MVVGLQGRYASGYLTLESAGTQVLHRHLEPVQQRQSVSLEQIRLLRNQNRAYVTMEDDGTDAPGINFAQSGTSRAVVYHSSDEFEPKRKRTRVDFCQRFPPEYRQTEAMMVIHCRLQGTLRDVPSIPKTHRGKV
ncbi:type II secretion system protein E [Anopheles sinensis]|uniref:Type II secretion system protein E n=1 Tax=Anopheles sinensis TaxID=74873 RepID=A0A084VFV6_ANOSI|nr:type II secretion system protein E [Anopheles sinensis]